MVRDAVCEAILNHLHGVGMNSSLNSTFIALILKKINHVFVSEFQLISLCNVLYKLVSKVITNRFKHVMPFIISGVLRKLITDNILLAQELLHSMKNDKKGKLWRMLVKLDMSKA